MEEAQVPCARANDFEEVITDPRVVHRGSLVEYEHPVGGRVRQPRPAAIFAELGHPWEELAELRRAGVLSQAR